MFGLQRFISLSTRENETLSKVNSSLLQDVMQNEEVSRLVLQATGRSFLSAAKELCAEAMIQGSTDNVTALVIDLRWAPSIHFLWLVEQKKISTQSSSYFAPFLPFSYC